MHDYQRDFIEFALARSALKFGTFTLKSKVRIGTEVIITFPPERVMSALGPMAEEAPPLQPDYEVVAEEKRRPRHKPIMSAGTGL